MERLDGANALVGQDVSYPFVLDREWHCEVGNGSYYAVITNLYKIKAVTICLNRPQNNVSVQITRNILL